MEGSTLPPTFWMKAVSSPREPSSLTRTTEMLPLPKLAIITNFPVLSIEMKQVLGAAGRGSIQQTQLSGRLIDGESADIRRMIQGWPQRERVFADRVKEAMVRRNSKERGIHHLCSQLGLAEFAGGGMEAADINSLALTLPHSPRLAVMHVLESGVGADVHEEVIVLSGYSLDSQEREGDKQTECVWGANNVHESY